MNNSASPGWQVSRSLVREAERVEPDGILIWDAQLARTPEARWFDPAAWRVNGTLLGAAEGRGTAHFLQSDAGRAWVLRHYRRGGLLAHLNRDHYLWLASSHTRPIREFRLVCALYNRGMAVPRPVAARALRRGGVAYTADLITEAIPDAASLADRLSESAIDVSGWQQLGATIAELHGVGVWHADLNARNVLVTGRRDFYLIDFDRARFRGDGAWREANLKRFRRSLDKFASNRQPFYFAEADWWALRDGYRDAWSAAPRL